MHSRHFERHYAHRIGWLRAAVLGANDGIVSIASLLVGVAAAQASHHDILVAGIAGLFAGAMAMAAGEYVSVSSQADTERADLTRERLELETNPVAEHDELAGIYVSRGLDRSLAEQVATQLMAHDALTAHARDELGLFAIHRARPIQASCASALTFALGASLPLGIAWLAPSDHVMSLVGGGAVASLAVLGVIAAWFGGAVRWTGAVRVMLWGVLAMGLTAGIGAISGTIL